MNNKDINAILSEFASLDWHLQEAFEEYIKEVKEGVFPDDSLHAYKIKQEEADKFEEALKN